MKLTLPSEVLNNGLAVVSPICGARTTLPILGSVLLTARDNKLTLRTTNLDVSLELDLPVAIDEPGEVAVPCAKLKAAMAKIDADEVTLSGTSKTLECCGDASWMKLFAFPAEEFPAVPAITPVHSLTAPDGLGAMLESAVNFVSEDETRYILNGICFASEDGKLSLVATDGRRLFRVTTAANIQSPAVVPALAARRLAALCGLGEVKLDFSESTLLATGPSWRLATKLIEGDFPNYRQVIPSPGKHRICAYRLDLAKALPFVDVIVTEKTTAVTVTADKGLLILNTLTPDLGEARVEIGAKVKGGAFRAGFNSKFLSDIFNAMRGEEVTLDSDGETCPLMIEENGFTAVLMPMRVA